MCRAFILRSALLTTLLTGLVLPALLLTTLLTGLVLSTLLTTLVLLAALLLLVLIVLVWIVHGLFLIVDFHSESTGGRALRSCVSFDTACSLLADNVGCPHHLVFVVTAFGTACECFVGRGERNVF